jgi:hypothetical protein
VSLGELFKGAQTICSTTKSDTSYPIAHWFESL